MELNKQYKDLTDFLQKHNTKQIQQNSSNSLTFTHTRIGDKDANIYGGSYIIPREELPTFYKLYYNHVFVKKNMEYLTERQLTENSPLLIDLDFRYNYSVEERQHTKEHIDDLVQTYLDELKTFFVFDKNKSFPIYVMEKSHVNRLTDESLTKDGIHIIIGIQMNHTMQIMLRENMIQKIPEVWSNDLPLINDWETVFDDGISKGTTNWQLYGSRKPNNLAYELTYCYKIEYDEADGEFMTTENMSEFNSNLPNNFCYLSAQYNQHAVFEINPDIKAEYEKRLPGNNNNNNNNNNTSNKKIKKKSKIKIVNKIQNSENDDDNDDNGDSDNDDNEIKLCDITSSEILGRAVNKMLSSFGFIDEYYLKEIHEYTQILPEKYYKPGSHNLNTQVAFALKHTDDRLFLSWVMLRSKADDFDFHTIPELYTKWKKQNIKENGITKKSIIYWAKQDAYDEYLKIRKNTIEYYLDITISEGQTDYDFALLLYQMSKDKFVCSSIKQNEWFVFNNHRWEKDEGHLLRKSISVDMFKLYDVKCQFIQNQIEQNSDDKDRIEKLRKQMATIFTIKLKLKKTSEKNNIVKEALEIFYDKDFIKNMDSNKYLMCFSNGVVDFKSGEFRNGFPQDYITKTTGIPYIEKLVSSDEKINEKYIYEFMRQLFPDSSLNKYMWDHLASVLIGENKNQTFNIYTGSGSNGKSILTDLMTKTLGDYKGIVPITLVTEKRTSLGGTCSELAQLKGVRYAVMQEPSKDARLNEGIMKELTGGDTIQARQLYSVSENFDPQFSLVVCTNNLPEINSNDDGTWRRIRIVPFMSKFLDADDVNWNDVEIQHKFPKDKDLKEKLQIYAPIFASILVKIAFQTKGNVADCEIVLMHSNKYRQKQDAIAVFMSEMIEKKEGERITPEEVCQEYKRWAGNANQKIPKREEIFEYMDKKFGKRITVQKKMCWTGVCIIVPEDGASPTFT